MVGSGCLKVNEPLNDQNKKKGLFFIAGSRKKKRKNKYDQTKTLKVTLYNTIMGWIKQASHAHLTKQTHQVRTLISLVIGN